MCGRRGSEPDGNQHPLIVLSKFSGVGDENLASVYLMPASFTLSLPLPHRDTAFINLLHPPSFLPPPLPSSRPYQTAPSLYHRRLVDRQAHTITTRVGLLQRLWLFDQRSKFAIAH